LNFMPYWMQSTFTALPAVLWAFFGLGLPWSLALLPRKDWRDRPLVIGFALALGPTLLTAWMFILGSFQQPLLRFDLIFAGTLIMALIGGVVAWRKKSYQEIGNVVGTRRALSLQFDELLLILLITLATLIAWISMAFWPFMVYDTLWVYGYEGRLYALLGYIPQTIGYYPQFLPLQYTYAQLAVGGIDDHAARAIIPFLHVGSILAVYSLGARLFNRRAGIIAAALWTLYPHVGQWSRAGDLEIPLTFLFTMASVFFLMAWTGDQHRRHYAALAGLMLGAGMWTKPTMGAFIWGVALLTVIDLIRVRLDWQAWKPRFQVALITGLTAAPLGLIWYIRNMALGHNPVDFPSSFWPTLAARSGVEFGWPLLALLVLIAYLYFGRSRVGEGLRPSPTKFIFLGLILILAGLLPSIIGQWAADAQSWSPLADSLSQTFKPHRMQWPEWIAFFAGVGILYGSLSRYARQQWDETTFKTAQRIGWASALALPYFVTWFYSYSYHYRLSFAIVPLMLLPTAVILTHWITAERVNCWRWPLRLAYLAGILAISVPGVRIPLYDQDAGWDWLWSDDLPDDLSRYRVGNPALMAVVEGLQAYKQDNPQDDLVVVAPAIKRLPFFFPLDTIRIDETPTRFDQMDGVDYFIYGRPESGGAYEGVPFTQNQLVAGLSRAGDHRTENPIMRRAWWKDDGIFFYDVYRLELQNRFIPLDPVNEVAEEVIFGDFAGFLGNDLGARDLWVGRPVILKLMWQALGPAPEDYMVYIHLRKADDPNTVYAAWDGPVSLTEDGQRYYSTMVWDAGEYILDERLIQLTDDGVPLGEGYTLVIGMYNLQTGQRIPVTIDGQPAGDGYILNEPMTVIEPKPES
jgi:4-amino-4-deoxy-L-arabinose transferase-like glycosyltransferase